MGELLDSSMVERYTHCVEVPGSIPGSAIYGRGFTFAQWGFTRFDSVQRFYYDGGVV